MFPAPRSIGNMMSILLRLFFAMVTAAIAEDSIPTVAVLDFEARGVAQEEAAAFADKFRYELLKTKAFDVMERNQMDLILKEQEFQLSGCVNQKCAVEVGQLIAVRKIVTGSASKVGEIFTLNVKLMDVQTGRIESNVSEDCDCPIERVHTYTLNRLARKLAGEQMEGSEVITRSGDASLYVITEPEGARLFLDGQFLEGRTPRTFENLPPGAHRVEARKDDLVGRQEVTLESHKVARLTVKLEKPRTLLKISSMPSDAEVYLGREPDYKSHPDQLTPAIFEDLEGKNVLVSLFKVGYRDTSFEAQLAGNQSNEYSVKMDEASLEQIKSQKRLVVKRKRRSIGGYMSLSSLAFLAGGGVLYYLARNDYDDAIKAKSVLEKSVLRSGPQYEATLKENHDKSSSGDLKAATALGLGGVGMALLAAGLVFYF